MLVKAFKVTVVKCLNYNDQAQSGRTTQGSCFVGLYIDSHSVATVNLVQL